jgi:hypothetical protein
VKARATFAPDAVRAKQALALGLAAIFSLGVAAASLGVPRLMRGEQSASGPVLKGFARSFERMGRIDVSSARLSVSLVRGDQGWTMPQRGGHPIDAQALANVAKALSDLSLTDVRATGPQAAARLGLDDPKGGGQGTHLVVTSTTGAALYDVFLRQTQGATLVRFANQDAIYEAKGALPRLDELALWLNLKPVDIMPENIASVQAQMAGEPAYDIVRRPDGGFAPLGGSANPVATQTALALTQFVAEDVHARASLTAQPLGTHTTFLRTGLHVVATFYQSETGTCAAIAAKADETGGQAAADAINKIAKGWCYDMPLTIAETFMTPRAAIMGSADALQ